MTEQLLADILEELRVIRTALEVRGITTGVLPNGMTEAQNEAAYISAIEQTASGDREAIVRFLKSGGKVISGKSFWLPPPTRVGRQKRKGCVP